MKSFQISILIVIYLNLHAANAADTIKTNISNNCISISYNGTEKISGGAPKFDGVYVKDEFKFSSSTSSIYSFTNSAIKVNILVKNGEFSNVIGFYLNVSNGQILKANNFIGLFFKQMPNFKQGVQIWRYKPWNSWTKPIKVSSPSELEDWDVQFFYWQYSDGTYGAAIPLCGNGFRTTLGSNENKFGAKAYTYADCIIKSEVPLMAVGFGKDPYQLFEQLYISGMKMMGKPVNLRSNKTYPKIFESIGWCSWNSSNMGIDLNEKLLDDAANSFVSNNFPLSWMIIDDGWSQNSNNQLTSFIPRSDRFPNGFKPVINTLKNKYGVKYIGAWHAFNCYWSGINFDSELGKQYEKSLYKWLDTNPSDPNDKGKECYMIQPYSDSLQVFYNSWHSWMKLQGIDFVKVDNQLVTERMAKNNFPIWDVADNMHKALYSSVNKYFNGAIINCMDMTNDAFYNFGSSAVARAVEDYFPYEKNETYNMQKGNAAAHVTQALYNSVYFQQMVWPDFDMFESYNPNGAFHAIARAISGGPVYVTDLPGRQNFEVLRPLVYANGQIIRADVPCKLTYDCLFQVQDAAPLKAYSFANGAGLLGIWNASDTNLVKGSFCVSDIHGLVGETFLVYEYFSKEYKIVNLNDSIQIELNRMKYLYYNVVPINKEIAIVGLTNKYNAPKTIEEQSVTNNIIKVKLHEGGNFTAYLPNIPIKVLINNKITDNYDYKNHWFELNISDHFNEPQNIEIILK